MSRTDFDEIKKDQMPTEMGKMANSIAETVDAYRALFRRSVSVVQLLLDEKAYDVAKAYIDFMKARETPSHPKAKP